MSDKVRYYLEQSVPELEDLIRKGLFTQKEISMIMRRRTDFEQRIQGRGCQPRDFIKYGEFELNLERLRKKRYSRLSSVGLINTKASVSDWAGVKRLLFIFERGTTKFPNDLELWSIYLAHAKKNGAVKRVYKIYSKLLKLQPRNVEAWLSATKYEFEENANAKGARGLFQKSLRLNPESFKLWINYAQFELTYVSKLLARRQVLGLITEKQQLEDESKLEVKKTKKNNVDDDDEVDDMNKDIIELPEDEVKQELNHLPEADMNMLGNPETNPVLRGDIALTVFDLCIPAILKEVTFKKDEKVFEIVDAFLRLFDQFDNLNKEHLYVHVLNYLQTNYPTELKTILIDVTLPIRNVEATSENLSDLLKMSVNKFFAYKSKISKEESITLTNIFTEFLNEKLLAGCEDERISNLIRAIIKRCRNN